MEPMRITRPHAEREVRLARFLAIVCLLVGLVFMMFGVVLIPSAGAGSLLFLFPGVLLCIGPFLLYRKWEEVLKIFQKANQSAEARVVERKRRKVRTGFSTSGGTGEGALIEIAIYLGIRMLEWMGLRETKYRYVGHRLIVEFESASDDHGGKKTVFELPVNKEAYASHPPGTVMRIRYAVGNPRIALLEEEFTSRFKAA
ncbi:MAG TPA: hypothetical protein G4O08_12165 [Anaerolineae bacterium]|nr:hypothetical protein [Anaerolineae bacterium]